MFRRQKYGIGTGIKGAVALGKGANQTGKAGLKAKKKIELQDEDTWIGVKSLFHSFRIIHFGIQLASTGTITNYSVCNLLWNEIENCSNNFTNWQEYYDTFKDRHNICMSAFREVAPKA